MAGIVWDLGVAVVWGVGTLGAGLGLGWAAWGAALYLGLVRVGTRDDVEPW